MEALGSQDYLEIPEGETLELALSNNKRIIEIKEKESEYNEEPKDSEFKDENYEEINNMSEVEVLGNLKSDDDEDKSKMTIAQLKRAEYSIDDKDLDQMNKESWNFPQITLKIKYLKLLSIKLELNMYVKKWKEVLSKIVKRMQQKLIS